MFKAFKINRELEEKSERYLKQLDVLTQDKHRLRAKLSQAEAELSSKDLVIKKANKELKEVKALVREQTDADLLINALKAIGVIKEEKKTDYRAEQERLMGLRNAAFNQAAVSYLSGSNGQAEGGFSSLFGGAI